MKPKDNYGEIATNENGIDGVIRYWDTKTQKYIGHRLDDTGRYWESKNPQLVGIRFVDFDEVKANTRLEYEDD